MQGVMFSNPHYRHYVNILVVIFTCWLHTRVSRGAGVSDWEEELAKVVTAAHLTAQV